MERLFVPIKKAIAYFKRNYIEKDKEVALYILLSHLLDYELKEHWLNMIGALVSDSMRGAGMPDGESILGSLENGMRVIIEDGVAKMPDRTSFTGSVATTDRLIRTMVKIADVPVVEAVKMMTSTPARIICIDKDRGSLSVGKRADIVIFDDDINVKMTMIKGRVITKDK